MATITQVGIATVSDELIEYIADRTKDNITTGDIRDYPDYSGQTDRYLSVIGTPGNETQAWKDLPPTGLVWRNQEQDVVMERNIGYITTGGLTLTLPEDPAPGEVVAVCDRDSQYSNNPVTILPNTGDTIEGDSVLILDLVNTYIQLIFSNGVWNITNVNHPFNISEITEEIFPAGNLTYYLGRIPASRASIMVIYQGKVLLTDQYFIEGNVLSFSTARLSPISVRYLGLPMTNPVTDTPLGTCADFPRLPPPDGWIVYDGSVISSSTYPELVRYLTKDPGATQATLPVADGWTYTDTGPTLTIPRVLRDNNWGRWMDSTASETSRNAWDDDVATSTSVLYDYSYVGYTFDIPVSVTSFEIYSEEVSDANLPTNLLLEYSIDGINWEVVSAGIPGGAAINNTIVTIPNSIDVNAEARYWRVIGTGGSPRAGDSGLFWGITTVTITGSTDRTLVGGDNLVGCIKAFNIQGESACNPSTSLEGLTLEVQRLAAIIEDL